MKKDITKVLIEKLYRRDPVRICDFCICAGYFIYFCCFCIKNQVKKTKKNVYLKTVAIQRDIFVKKTRLFGLLDELIMSHLKLVSL